MTSTGDDHGTGDRSFPLMADAVRAATEGAAELWRAGAEALAAQAEAIRRHPLPYPVPGLDRYLELLRQAAEVNRELADQWVAAVRTMTATLVPSGGTATPVDSVVSPTSPSGSGTPIDPEPPAAAVPVTPAPSTTVVVVPDAAPVPAAPADPAPAEPAPADPAPAAAPRGARTRRTGRSPAPTPTVDPDDPRAAYVRLGKAALSAKLAERGLPRSGTLAQLVNRLIEAEAAERPEG